jgi:predicted nucleic acid binding AN1-type Zn finger protein
MEKPTSPKNADIICSEDKKGFNDLNGARSITVSNIKELSSIINNLENTGNIIYITNDKKKKKKKNRCSHQDCRKKLTLIDLEKKCDCSKSFCMSHFQPFSHNCDFDHKSKTKQIIRENNPKCENVKFEKM